MVEHTQTEADLKYKVVLKRVNAWLPLHKGETFDLDQICRQCEIGTADARNYVSTILSKEVEKKLLEKMGGRGVYRYIDNTIKYIDWVNARDANVLALTYPYGVDDGSAFSFAEYVNIHPKDVIVIAGVSNTGKTCWILNQLWNNMDLYPCTLMGNEYEGSKFKARVSGMTWLDPVREDGTPKFELIERRSGWKDIIRPNNINFIDWISLSGKADFYSIGAVIEGIQEKLDRGIAVIAIQKSSGKDLGEGGQFSEHLSSLYLLMDFKRLTVRKAKDWHGVNPNGKVYGFDIVEGIKFQNIRPQIKCSNCYGHGISKGGECSYCKGTGWVDTGISI